MQLRVHGGQPIALFLEGGHAREALVDCGLLCEQLRFLFSQSDVSICCRLFGIAFVAGLEELGAEGFDIALVRRSRRLPFVDRGGEFGRLEGLPSVALRAAVRAIRPSWRRCV